MCFWSEHIGIAYTMPYQLNENSFIIQYVVTVISFQTCMTFPF